MILTDPDLDPSLQAISNPVSGPTLKKCRVKNRHSLCQGKSIQSRIWIRNETKMFRIRPDPNPKHYVYVHILYTQLNAVCVPMNGVNGIRGMLWYGVVANSVIVFNKIITPIYAQGVQLRNVSLTCIN